MSWQRIRLFVVLGSGILGFVFVSTVNAGSIFVTGHDPDYHATKGDNTVGAHKILTVAINYAINGSTKPILFLQTRTTPTSNRHALSDAGLIAAGINPCPSSPPCFDKLNVTQFATANLSNYGAIVLPSDYGGTLSQDELNAVNARSNEIIEYLNAGGGLVALAESGEGDSDVTSGAYKFLPFLVSAPPLTRLETGYTVSPFGASLGLSNSDVNGNFSHNIFVDGQGMQVVDINSDASVVSLAFRGQICDGTPCPGVQSTLQVIKLGTGSGTVSSSPAGINCGSSCIADFNTGTVVPLTVTPATGSSFSGWSGDPDCSDGSVTLNANKYCIATFNVSSTGQTTLSVSKTGTGSGTVTSTPSGINCGATCSANFTSGTAVALTAAPASGSTFAGWSGDSDCSDASVTVNASKSCIATFNLAAADQFTLSVNKAGSGIGAVISSPVKINCGSMCSVGFTKGAVVTLTATPANGSIFAGWSGDPDCSDGSVTMDGNKGCTATFNVAGTPGIPELSPPWILLLMALFSLLLIREFRRRAQA